MTDFQCLLEFASFPVNTSQALVQLREQYFITTESLDECGCASPPLYTRVEGPLVIADLHKGPCELRRRELPAGATTDCVHQVSKHLGLSYACSVEIDGVIERALNMADEYFMGISKIHQTATNLSKRMAEERIEIAIAGALALNVHGVVRMTEDVDVLITQEGLIQFKKLWLGRGYVEVRPGGKSIRDTETNVRIDFLVAGDFPGDGKPKPVAFPQPIEARIAGERFAVLSLTKIVELKLASGMTAKDRPQDLADVIRLIRTRKLPLEFQNQLSPYVAAKYAELHEIALQPEEDY